MTEHLRLRLFRWAKWAVLVAAALMLVLFVVLHFVKSANPPIAEPAEPRWSQRYPGVPDSYDPSTDGPVWLGPYKFDAKFAPADGGIGPQMMTFQMLVLGDEVSFYRRAPGGSRPKGSWVTFNILSHTSYEPSLAPGTRVTVISDQGEFEAIWEPVASMYLRMPNVIKQDGSPVTFLCHPTKEQFVESEREQSLAALSENGINNSCRAFMMLRPGVNLQIEFPMRLAQTAHAPVTKAIAMIIDAIKEK